MVKKNSVIEIVVGQGWAVGYIGFGRRSNHYFADRTSVICKTFRGLCRWKRRNVVTDTDWEVYTNPVTMTEIYHGETFDSTLISTLLGNAVLSDVDTNLVPQDGEWIREQERLMPIELIKTPKGETVIDFGQNMTGYVEVKAHGKRGEKIVIHHAEVLDKKGNFYTANMRGAKNENTYILSGGNDVFKPIYTFQGFRYIKLVGYNIRENGSATCSYLFPEWVSGTSKIDRNTEEHFFAERRGGFANAFSNDQDFSLYFLMKMTFDLQRI